MANPVSDAAAKVTQRSGTYSGKGMLTAELLVGFGIILIRIIGDFTVDDATGKAKSNVLHNSEVYGPFPIAIGLIGVFFILSFLAASGGKKAKFAVVFGGLVVTALGVKSVGEVDKIAKTIGNIGTYQVPPPSGKEGSGASSPNATVTIPGASAPADGSPAPSPAPTGSVSPIPLIPPSIFPGGPGTGTTPVGTVKPGPPPIPTTGPGSPGDPLS